MTDSDTHFTVFIRLPFNRGDFIDPPPVAWSASKERELWDIISRQSKGNEIDWRSLAEEFQVTQQFLLQQAAWLYERQLSQVRAQMRRMGNRQSASASPAPTSASGSVVGGQAAKKAAGLTSRNPSRLSTQTPVAVTPADTSIPSTPARSRTSLPLKSNVPASSGNTARSQLPPSQPLSRRSSKDNVVTSRTHSRRGSIQQQLPKSPIDDSSSSEDETTTKTTHRRPNPASAQRRTAGMRKSQHARTASIGIQQLHKQQEEDEDEDDPAFLPFASTSGGADQTSVTSSDPSATLRGIPSQQSNKSTSRPSLERNRTSERVRPSPTATPSSTITSARAKETHSHPQSQPQLQSRPQPRHQLTSSTSSLSSNASPRPATTTAVNPSRLAPAPTATTTTRPPQLPTPLSPHQQAALATAAGLSPRHRATSSRQHTHTGSESSPSMGSSFSDLDDASVTQSALEEALMSNMGALGSTAGVAGGGGVTGALGSRVSGIGQALGLRSRYFDARGSNTGNGNGGGGEGLR